LEGDLYSRKGLLDKLLSLAGAAAVSSPASVLNHDFVHHIAENA
jgi:hypothetical protein